MKLKKLLMCAAISMAVAGPALADLNNTRPYNPGAGNLGSLQSIFTGIGSSIDVYTEQESAAIFSPTGFGGSASSYVASASWGFGATEIGMYSYGSPGTDVTLFNSAMTPGSRVSITFFGNGTVTTTNLDTGTVVDTQAGFGTSFGFYFKSASGDPTWYTEDSLNNFAPNDSSNLTQALIYAGNGDAVTLPPPSLSGLSDIGHYYVAFEGRHNDQSFGFGSGSIDFNDAVIMLESVTPVPEPEIYAMLAAGLGLMGFVARRRKPQAV